MWREGCALLGEDDAVAHHQPRLSEGMEIGQGVAGDDQEIGDPARLDGAQLLLQAADVGGMAGGGDHDLHGAVVLAALGAARAGVDVKGGACYNGPMTKQDSSMPHPPTPPHGRRIDSDPYFTLMADADGVGFVHCGDSVLVVPLTDDGGVLLAVERSPAFDREVLVLVGGSVEPGEPLEETANRELQEELGWRAGRLDYLGELHPFKYLTARQFVFLARDLVPGKLPGDEQHPVRARRIAPDQVVEMCRSGELRDAAAIAALLLAQRVLAEGG